MLSPSGSEDAEASTSTVMRDRARVKEAMGAVLPPTVMSWDREALRPVVSVTVRVTAKVPEAAYAWEAVSPEAMPPSPKAHAYPAMGLSGSVVPDASNMTASPVCGAAGANVNAGTG